MPTPSIPTQSQPTMAAIADHWRDQGQAPTRRYLGAALDRSDAAIASDIRILRALGLLHPSGPVTPVDLAFVLAPAAEAPR